MEEIDERVREGSVVVEAGVEILELSGAGEVAVKEEERGFLEGDGFREFLDAIAAIFEASRAFFSFHAGDRGFVRDNPLKTRAVLVF